jgi:hypothetical protein
MRFDPLNIQEIDMNPYANLASSIGTTEGASLGARLTAWHDAMVAHLRRLRSNRASDVCDEDCPHVEARALWREAVAMFGAQAARLSFLRTHGASRPTFVDRAVMSTNAGMES